ncbi:hypothetical protein SAY86_028010 [Trapa natans]|uniref:Hepcidin n=1 Tax=Trapa natans TaxID=22666 RepID=A0AAN7LZY9_TRANT|nr:hypothetical protein SAY86_028010 [Trapa natans]
MMRSSKVSLLVLGLVATVLLREIAAATAQDQKTGTSTASGNVVNAVKHIGGHEDAFFIPKPIHIPVIPRPRPICNTCCDRRSGGYCYSLCCRCC